MKNKVVISVSVRKEIADSLIKHCDENFISRSRFTESTLEDYMISQGLLKLNWNNNPKKVGKGRKKI